MTGTRSMAPPRDLPAAETPMPKPFVHVVKVGWADCDPAQIAYTGHIPGFALRAIDAWWEALAGYDWYRLNIDAGMGTPFVHLELDFHSPVTPRHPLACEVRVSKVGRTSIGFEVDGRQDGTLCFTGKFACVFVDAATFGKMEVPPRLRAAIEAARDA